MKKFFFLVIVLVALGLCCQSCSRFMFSHNPMMVGFGKYFNLGIDGYGITYVNGMVATGVMRENGKFFIETNDDDSFTNPTSAVKGVRSIRFCTGPQITGYLCDIAKEAPDVAKSYVENMPKINKAQWDAKQTKPAEAPALKYEAASTVVEQAKSVLEPFTCSGNCELTDLGKISSITYQSAVAIKLLTYADDTTKWAGEEQTFKHSLESFLSRMEQLTAKGKSVSQMRIKYAKLVGGKLADLNFIMVKDNGQSFDTHCPECVPLED